MKTAKQYLGGYKRLIDSDYYVSAEDFEDAIRTARAEAIIQCAKIAKIKKVGNSGSYFDAAVDASSILSLLKENK